METVITLIVLGIIIAASWMTYQHKRVKNRQFLLSEQIFPSLILSVIIEKFQNNITHVIIRIKALDQLQINGLSLELINKKREFNHYNLIAKGLTPPLNSRLNANSTTDIKIDYEQMKQLLENGDLPFRTFRFVIADHTDKKFKSHELGLNKKWQLLRPDSGNYN
jgi:hypothetical protein